MLKKLKNDEVLENLGESMRFDRIVNLFLFGILIVMIAGSAEFKIMKGETDYFTIDDSGNVKIGDGSGSIYLKDNKVGIGTNDPKAKLHVNGDVRVNGNYYWLASKNFKMIGSGEFSFDFADGDGNDYWHVWDPSHGPILVVRNNGNVGIGTTSPQAKLDVNGDVRITANCQRDENTLECSGTHACYKPAKCDSDHPFLVGWDIKMLKDQSGGDPDGDADFCSVMSYQIKNGSNPGYIKVVLSEDLHGADGTEVKCSVKLRCCKHGLIFG